MIAPTISEQLKALREAVAHAKGAAFEASTTPERRAAVLDYIATRIEIFANKAAANRREQA